MRIVNLLDPLSDKTLKELGLLMEQNGEHAKAFGELLKDLWLSRNNPVELRFFKTQVDIVHSFMKGLHQDLKRKPYIELKDSDSRSNDFVIVNVCQGQCKSTMICPVCGKKSITVDPFKCLSLPSYAINT
ncbi:unnamed protein product [Brassica rapa subsp. trilocularis]